MIGRRRTPTSARAVGAVTLTLLGWVLLPGAARAQSDRAAAPDTVEFPSGARTLLGIVYRPTGPGRHPAVLYLHGSGADYTRQVQAVGPLYAAAGYVLFVPFRRGQGLSVGRGEAIVERMDREGEANGPEARMRLMTELLMTEQMDDVRAGLHYLQARDDVDAGRIAVAGNSFGGILSVLSAAYLDGIRAVVSSAPAALTWARAPELRDRLREAARTARVPVFFMQAENDADLTPTSELAREMETAGKPHRRKVFPAFGTTSAEGHSFGYFGGATYGPDVFDFLARYLGATEGSLDLS